MRFPRISAPDRKSTRLNSSHTVISTLSLHDRSSDLDRANFWPRIDEPCEQFTTRAAIQSILNAVPKDLRPRSEEHTSELQSHSDLHSFPTRPLFRSGSSELLAADR